MPTTYQHGMASLTVDQDAVLRRLDEVLEGAPRRFLAQTTEALADIRGPAQARWPRRTGRTAESLTIRPSVTRDAVVVQLQAHGPDVFRQRWSVRLEADLDAEAREAGRRGLTPLTSAALERNWRQLLTRRHGRGAPSELLAGQGVWARLVRAPANRDAQRVIDALRGELHALAGAG